MSQSKTEQFKTKAEMRAYSLKRAAEVAEASKKKAMADATAPLGACSIVAFLLIAGIIAFPTLGVLVFIV